MRRCLTTLTALCFATALASPASAQLYRVPSQRTIVLSPGWHLAGPPVRSARGLRFAVRSDAGVMKDMTVLPNGAITFSDQEPRTKAARPHAARKQRPAPPPRISSEAKATDASPKPADERPTPAAAAGDPGSSGHKAEARTASVSAAAALPDPVPAPRPAPAPKPAPVRKGPGFAHGVPINPLD
jgi:hypothetical protein